MTTGRWLLVTVCAGACSSSPNHNAPDSGNGSGGDAGIVDPHKDTDGDGIPDISDNCPAIANADQHDHDGDGRGDVCDVCPHLFDAGGDTDGDGVGDACDPRPGTPGDHILFFEGFYGPVAWTAVQGQLTDWTFDGNTAHQANTTGVFQIVRPASPVPNNVFVETRVKINATGATTGRRSVSLVLGYQNMTDYLFCGIAAQNGATEIDAGEVFSTTFDANPGVFPDAMAGDWLVLQGSTSQPQNGATTTDCLGVRGSTNGQSEFMAQRPAQGLIGLRTNAADASFDYVFAVSVPPPQ